MASDDEVFSWDDNYEEKEVDSDTGSEYTAHTSDESDESYDETFDESQSSYYNYNEYDSGIFTNSDTSNDSTLNSEDISYINYISISSYGQDSADDSAINMNNETDDDWSTFDDHTDSYSDIENENIDKYDSSMHSFSYDSDNESSYTNNSNANNQNDNESNGEIVSTPNCESEIDNIISENDDHTNSANNCEIISIPITENIEGTCKSPNNNNTEGDVLINNKSDNDNDIDIISNTAITNVDEIDIQTDNNKIEDEVTKVPCSMKLKSKSKDPFLGVMSSEDDSDNETSARKLIPIYKIFCKTPLEYVFKVEYKYEQEEEDYEIYDLEAFQMEKYTFKQQRSFEKEAKKLETQELLLHLMNQTAHKETRRRNQKTFKYLYQKGAKNILKAPTSPTTTKRTKFSQII